MRLAAHSRIVGALALAVVAVALAPGTSFAYRLTQQEYARMVQASHQGAAPVTSAGGSVTHREIARPAQLTRQDPASVAEAPAVRPNPDQQVPHARGPAGTSSQPVQVPGKHGITPRYPIAATASSAKQPSDGFDYGDAAVGAGIAAAIVLLATTATLTVRRRHEPQHG